MRSAPLRRRLLTLSVAAILPLAALAGVGLFVFVRQQSAQIERVGLELTRSMANAVDTELRSQMTTLQTLAATDTLDRGDLVGFRQLARRVLAQHAAWEAITLADLTGAVLVDTRRADSAPAIVDSESFEAVTRRLQPVVGSLVQHGDGRWLFALRTPVSHAGVPRFIATALVKPDVIHDVVARQRVPADWLVSIVDAKGRRVARSRAHAENLGGRLSETGQRVLAAGGGEGVGVSTSLEGERIFTPFSRLASTGWVAVFGIPTALVDAAAYRSLVVYGSGVALSLALAAFGAFWMARRVARPIADLGLAASALGGGAAAPAWTPSGIREIDAVGRALETAHRDLIAAAAEREALLRNERQARAVAEAADRAKDQFLAVLSHELRTPLNAVYGWASMLHNGQITGDDENVRAGDAILRNANVLIRLIDDLLDLSRIATGKMRLEVTTAHLGPVVTEAIDTIGLAAEAKGITIEAVLDPAAGPILGDPARLRQVLWNLLMNAVKFTPPGGRIYVELSRADRQLQLVVRDTGCGITADVLPFVFERFRQGPDPVNRTHGGLGLGLALVKHLVELHGGTVTAHSDGEGRGATFVVRLSTETARLAHAAVVPEPPLVPGPPPAPVDR